MTQPNGPDMTTNHRFHDKVAFVTGAGSGIGRAAAVRLAHEGADVAVVGLDADDNRETARQIEALGARQLVITCDVTDSDAVRRALQTTVEAFGGLDIAFNNAGIEQPAAATADITEGEWDRVLAVDLRAVFVCMRHEIPLLLAARRRSDREHLIRRRRQGLRRPSRLRAQPSTASSVSPDPPPSTTPRRTSASTPSAPGSSTPR